MRNGFLGIEITESIFRGRFQNRAASFSKSYRRTCIDTSTGTRASTYNGKDNDLRIGVDFESAVPNSSTLRR